MARSLPSSLGHRPVSFAGAQPAFRAPRPRMSLKSLSLPDCLSLSRPTTHPPRLSPWRAGICVSSVHRRVPSAQTVPGPQGAAHRHLTPGGGAGRNPDSRSGDETPARGTEPALQLAPGAPRALLEGAPGPSPRGGGAAGCPGPPQGHPPSRSSEQTSERGAGPREGAAS